MKKDRFKGCFGSKRAFTLIELLVVVLIISILAAVAVPQYQKAIEKSRASEALVVLRTLGAAQEAYYLENGRYATEFSQLGVAVPSPWKQVEHDRYSSDVYHADSRSLLITAEAPWTGSIFLKKRNASGKYGGGAFVYVPEKIKYSAPKQRVYCIEYKSFYPEQGMYCTPLFGATYQFHTGAMWWYRMGV